MREAAIRLARLVRSARSHNRLPERQHLTGTKATLLYDLKNEPTHVSMAIARAVNETRIGLFVFQNLRPLQMEQD